MVTSMDGGGGTRFCCDPYGGSRGTDNIGQLEACGACQAVAAFRSLYKHPNDQGSEPRNLAIYDTNQMMGSRSYSLPDTPILKRVHQSGARKR